MRWLLLLSVLVGCYSDPDLSALLEPSPTPTAEAAPAAAPARPDVPEADLGRWLTDLRAGADRLRTDEPSASKRPGADSWRTPELDKLAELVTMCCGTAACARCLEPIAAAELPVDELWPVLRLFLTKLKPQAQAGVEGLAVPTMLRVDHRTKDRIFRLAVGSGGARRGQPNAASQRISWVPLQPLAGEPLVLIGEMSAPCPVARSSLKGPDASGRVDLDFGFDCPPVPELSEGELPDPKASRAIEAWPLAALPEGGLTVWLADQEEPAAVITPAPGLKPLPPPQ